MSVRAIADLQSSVDELRKALAQDDWESCELELETGERMQLSRQEAEQAITEGETELRRLRHALN